MLRLLVLIGAFFLFRAMLPRGARRSSSATSPYMNALDGMIPAQQLSSILDEVSPYESWHASHTKRRKYRCRDRTSRHQHAEVITPSRSHWVWDLSTRVASGLCLRAMLRARFTRRLS